MYLRALHVLAEDACLLLPVLPFIGGHVVKSEPGAGVGFVAADSHWVEPRVVSRNVLQSDVPDGNSRLGLACAFRVEGK